MTKRIGLGIAALLLGTACGASKPISFSARTGAVAATGTAPLTVASTSSALTLNGGAVVVDELEMVLRDVKLEKTPTAAGSPDTEGTQEIDLGPALVHLCSDAANAADPTCPKGLDPQPATGGSAPPVVTLFQGTVDAGTYRQIQFEIHMVEAADAAAHPELAPMTGLSVRIRGSYAGTSFVFTSSLDEEREQENTFTVGDGVNNITFDVDPTNWFTGPSGALDPGNPANQSAIEANIKASIDIYEDDNRDGVPD